ncbi:MAG: motility associated factor glycosyltransferase family protein [Epsilonproteobacteria bacterium]|nr:motility associated factor glycosyltransferase family protein [Campylobacterota bacterium]
MEDIQNLAIATYQNNLEYINKEHKELAKLLNIFETALQKGDYEPRFDLEYVNGSFDVKELATGRYLYAKNSAALSKEFAASINYSKDHHIFEGFPVYNFSEETLKALSEDAIAIEGVLSIMRYYSINQPSRREMKEIKKFIFIGTGLGLHITLIDAKIQGSEYIIIEDDLELFKLSLFTTPYYEIARHAELFFCVADDENIFLKTMQAFLDSNFFYNRYLKYFKFPTHSIEKIKQIQNALTTQTFIFFPYKADLYKNIRPLEYLNQGYNLLNVGTNFTSKLFYEKPVLVLAAGPSFGQNIEWVKANGHRFIIIAVSAILNTLYKHGIKPDLVTHLDGSTMAAKHFDSVKESDFLDQTLMLFGPNTPRSVRELFTKEQIFYYDEGSDYVKSLGSIYAPCIGSTSLVMSLIFNSKDIYLLGLDLAINQETGETHSSEHLYTSKSDIEKKHELSQTMEYVKNLFPVKGNFTETVYTNALLHSSVQSLYKNMAVYKRPDQHLYNMSQGAYINMALPTRIESIPVESFTSIDKSRLNAELLALFKEHSIQELPPEAKNAMMGRLSAAKESYELIKAYQNSVSHSNSERYIYQLLGLVSDLLKLHPKENKNLSYTYLLFFKYALSIVMDFFNTKELKNTKRDIKKFDKMIQHEMVDIATIYIDALENFLAKE